MSRPAALAAVAVAALAPLAAADVLVVDGGVIGFTEIQDAVAVAGANDTILVKTGSYGAVVIDDLAVVLTADRTAVVSATKVTVRNLQAGLTTVVRGIDAPLELTSNAGFVRVEDVTAVGQTGFVSCTLIPPATLIPGRPGALVDGCHSVAFERCSLTGGEGGAGFDPSGVGFCTSAGGPGVVTTDSDVVLDGCTLLGGRGGYNLGDGIGSAGGPGLRIVSGTATVIGTSVTGGENRTTHAFFCMGNPASCTGAAGLLIESTSGHARLRDATLTGGAGTVAQGPGLSAPGGTTETWTASGRGFLVPSPLREGEASSLQFQGLQGEIVLLFWSLGSGHYDLPYHQNVFTLDYDALDRLLVMGGIPSPSGALSIPIVLPSLPPAFMDVTLHLQAAFLGVEGDIIGPQSSLTVLDSAF